MGFDFRRLPLVFVPAGLLVGFVLFVTVGSPVLLANQPKPPPREPIAFPHNVHVQVVGLECTFCHRTAPSGINAGYPDIEQCMFCHGVAGRGFVEADKVRTSWLNQQPIDWERIHRLPDHVHFVHSAHIQAGIQCSTCHGDVGAMTQVVQVRPLTMGDCLACHRQANAPTECATCHY
jgi:Cytochrome c7 and related cytochrome c/Class III cytochrome C family